jgi:uncharacterized membrane-anchored protein YitT (DUF2179 family)
VSEEAPPRHSLLEDLQAIVTAAGFVSLGFFLLGQARLLTGGISGVSLLLARFAPLSFGQLLVILNAPFAWLAVRQLGWAFTGKTAAAVVLTGLLTDSLHHVVVLQWIHPGYAAVLGGALVGIGLLILFRHGASLGGLGVLALWLQARRRLSAGLFQMAVDALIVVASLFLVPPATVAWSVLGALALNLVLAVNHRPGRYLGA